MRRPTMFDVSIDYHTVLYHAAKTMPPSGLMKFSQLNLTWCISLSVVCRSLFDGDFLGASYVSGLLVEYLVAHCL